jgi:hypothetical protein
MNRRSRFFIGLIAAAITYASLMAFIGPRHFRGHYGRHGACAKDGFEQQWGRGHGCHGHDAAPVDSTGRQ